MPLYLHEIRVSGDERDRRRTFADRAAQAARAAGAQVVESKAGVDLDVLYTIFSADDEAGLASELDQRGLGTELTPVRLVGTDLVDVLDGEGEGGSHLVEWDLPEGLEMETYLARKREKSPRYAEVPETRFLRTYVREDMEKCLCLYDAPDEDAVCRAREAVETPVDRLTRLEGA